MRGENCRIAMHRLYAIWGNTPDAERKYDTVVPLLGNGSRHSLRTLFSTSIIWANFTGFSKTRVKPACSALSRSGPSA